MFNNLTTCKGFILRTNPEDVAAGKRAKVLLGGMHTTGSKCQLNEPDVWSSTTSRRRWRNLHEDA